MICFLVHAHSPAYILINSQLVTNLTNSSNDSTNRAVPITPPITICPSVSDSTSAAWSLFFRTPKKAQNTALATSYGRSLDGFFSFFLQISPVSPETSVEAKSLLSSKNVYEIVTVFISAGNPDSIRN